METGNPTEEQEEAVRIAEEALSIMRERNETYTYNSLHERNLYITIMMLLYPKGVPGEYKAMMRYKFISYIIDKLCRYVININRNGHEDSLIDIGNYSFMLAAFDRIQRQKEGPK
jgi:hypothetical protein